MLRTISLLLVSALTTLFVVTTAQGHGIPLSISIDPSNRLFSESLVTYDADESELLLTATGVKGAAGFYPKFGVFPTGGVLTVDAAGSSTHPLALLYWDGSNLLPSPVNVALTRTGINMLVTPSDSFVPGGDLRPYNGELGGHTALTITLPSDAPTGLYGIGFQVTSPGYQRSRTFWGIANYGLSEDDALAGLAAIHSQVPEPAGTALATIGLAGLAFVARRARRSRV